MKKDNKLTKFVAFVLLITLLALILVSNTYAKYTSSQDLSATATVAKWAIKVNDNDILESVTFDLFKHTDSNVKSDKIAPGTTGNFAINVTNESEVAAKYEITFDALENTKNIPLEFSTDDSNWTKDITTLKPTKVLDMADNKEDTVTIYWRWAFEGKDSTNYTVDQTDSTDTALGTAATTETIKATVTAHLTATQVD